MELLPQCNCIFTSQQVKNPIKEHIARQREGSFYLYTNTFQVMFANIVFVIDAMIPLQFVRRNDPRSFQDCSSPFLTLETPTGLLDIPNHIIDLGKTVKNWHSASYLSFVNLIPHGGFVTTRSGAGLGTQVAQFSFSRVTQSRIWEP